MIKIEHVLTASPEQMMFIIEGMRNPFNSWDSSDSFIYGNEGSSPLCRTCDDDCMNCIHYTAEEGDFWIGEKDYNRMRKLAAAGTDHRKFMRMIPVYLRITAPLYWWKEFDTYKVGTVANSCSTMHKITEKEFTMDDFSTDHLDGIGKFIMSKIIDNLNDSRLMYLEMDRKIKGKEFSGDESIYSLEEKRKNCWWQMIQLLPSSYNQTRNVMLNYETLANIYKSRKNHKLDEWQVLCKLIERLPYSILITGELKEDNKND